MEALAQKLKKVREEAGLSQKDFAHRLGVGPVSMNRLEKGNQAPDCHVLLGLRSLFGVDLNWLLRNDDSPINAPEPSIPIWDEAQLVEPDNLRRRDHVLNLPGVEGDFAFRVRDEAMLPMVRPGDYVVVDTARDPGLGDLVLIQRDDRIVHVRRVSQEDNQMLLSVSNPDYGPASEIDDSTVLGRINRIVRTVEV